MRTEAEGRDDERPRVSVIIPTYNRADYIEQAIDSVIEQRFPGVEIIVVDDGSIDDTRARVAKYGNCVRYVYTDNGGIGHARNVGLTHARGAYITSLDSDDQHYPYTLEVHSRALDRHADVGMVYAEMSGFDDKGWLDRFHLRAYHESAYRGQTYDTIFESSVPLAAAGVLPQSLADAEPELTERRAYLGQIFDTYLLHLVVFHNNIMFRRELLPVVGRLNERLTPWQDYDFALRLCRVTRACFLDVPTYRLRYHSGQITTTARSDGKYVWMRKQQGLLRTVHRHALRDREYYVRNRIRIDRQLANLHRAVAVPMMLGGKAGDTRRRYARRARMHLARCRRYRHPFPLLWLMTFAPGPVRRIGVTVIERLRQSRFTRWNTARA